MLRFWILAVGLWMMLPSARAATAPGSTQATVRAPFSSVHLDLYGWSYGNAIDTWDGRKATVDGSQGTEIQVTNQLNLHTPGFGEFDFTFIPQFVLQPFRGQTFQLLNPTIGFQGPIADSGAFSYWARFETFLPLLQSSRDEGMITAPQTIQVLTFRLSPQFKLESVIVPSVNLFNNGDLSAFLYASPRLFYTLNDSWWFVALVETYAEIKRAASQITQASPTNFGAGVRYTSLNGKGLWVQPFLNVYPTGRIGAMHLGMMFGGPLL